IEPWLEERPPAVHPPRRTSRATLESGTDRRAALLTISAVATTALVLRLLHAREQSAYMDEASFILTGRMLIEEHRVYAGALNWTYGSYLWSLVAGLADIVGGLALVRTLVAALGAAMAAATALTAARLASRALAASQRWIVGLLAGLFMAAFPTAVGVGRFGTYDALSGAAVMA